MEGLLSTARMWTQGTALWSQVSPNSFTRVLGMELKSPGLCSHFPGRPALRPSTFWETTQGIQGIDAWVHAQTFYFLISITWRTL